MYSTCTPRPSFSCFVFPEPIHCRLQLWGFYGLKQIVNSRKFKCFHGIFAISSSKTMEKSISSSLKIKQLQSAMAGHFNIQKHQIGFVFMDWFDTFWQIGAGIQHLGSRAKFFNMPFSRLRAPSSSSMMITFTGSIYTKVLNYFIPVFPVSETSLWVRQSGCESAQRFQVSSPKCRSCRYIPHPLSPSPLVQKVRAWASWRW